jgi:hypothetical protein
MLVGFRSRRWTALFVLTALSLGIGSMSVRAQSANDSDVLKQRVQQLVLSNLPGIQETTCSDFDPCLYSDLGANISQRDRFHELA